MLLTLGIPCLLASYVVAFFAAIKRSRFKPLLISFIASAGAAFLVLFAAAVNPFQAHEMVPVIGMFGFIALVINVVCLFLSDDAYNGKGKKWWQV